MTTCFVEGCTKAPRARGLCIGHYKRMRRYGDPHGSKPRFSKVLQYFNDVVLNHFGDECLSWPFSRNFQGYGNIRVKGKTRIVSRLVCEQENGPPPTPIHEAAHSCGNGHLACVARKHLSWKTHTDNAADMVEHGTLARGEKHGRSKLSETEVRQIRALRGNASKREIASMFGITQGAVWKIQHNKTWNCGEVL